MNEPIDALLPVSGSKVSYREDWLWAGLLVLLTLIVYQPAIRGAFLWDDNRYAMIGVNTPLRDGGGLEKIWFKPSTTGNAGEPGFTTVQYYPLTFTAFWVEYHLFGLNTSAYHLVNILIHAGSALLLWQLLKLLKVPGGWVAAAVFAVHPIEVESVAWITELKNVLSGLFFLGSIYAYLCFVGERKRISPWGWYAIAFGCFAGAVFSKTVTSLMPVVTGLLIYWRYRERFNLRTILGLAPFLVLGGILSRQTAWMEQHVVGAMGVDWNLTGVQRVLLAGHAFWFYLGKLFWPVHLIFTYPRMVPGGDDYLGWICVIAAGMVLMVSAVWLLIGRQFRGVPVAVLAYGVLLFPAMGFFNVYPMRYSFVADHFQYHAGIAIIVLMVAILTRAIWRGERAARAQVVQGFVGVVIFVLAVLTWRQSAIYADPIALWQDTAVRNPSAWMAHYNLGTELIRRAAEEGASGNAEAAVKSLNDACDHLARCVALRPEHAGAYNNWARALLDLNRPSEAVFKASRAIEIEPGNSEAHVTLGLAYMRSGKRAEAEGEFQRAIALDPKVFLAHLNLGHILASENKYREAQASFEKAKELRPENGAVYYALAVLLDHQLKYKEALPEAARAVELEPENSDYLATLGFIWGENGRPREAYAAFAKALEINPDNKRAYEGAKALVNAVGQMRRAATTRAATQHSTTTRAAQ
jgi:tetratricopeptide (TPR) repeat protein